MSKMEEYIKVSDLLKYCEQAANICENLRQRSMYFDAIENTATRRIADFAIIEEYFSREFCKWTFDIPNMIKAIASGEWKAEDKQCEN